MGYFNDSGIPRGDQDLYDRMRSESPTTDEAHGRVLESDWNRNVRAIRKAQQAPVEDISPLLCSKNAMRRSGAIKLVAYIGRLEEGLSYAISALTGIVEHPVSYTGGTVAAMRGAALKAVNELTWRPDRAPLTPPTCPSCLGALRWDPDLEGWFCDQDHGKKPRP